MISALACAREAASPPKKAKRFNYQRTTTTGKTYVHSVFSKYFHAYYLTSREETRMGIVYLDNAEGFGTHLAYAKKGNRAIYFDSFGRKNCNIWT